MSYFIGKRILIIDDDDAICELARWCLEVVPDWQVLAAHSGKEGLARADAERPDAILLDVMMPDVDGPAVLQALRANPATRSIPVVFLTGDVLPVDRRRFANMGAEAVIPKPFEALRLARQVAAILGWK